MSLYPHFSAQETSLPPPRYVPSPNTGILWPSFSVFIGTNSAIAFNVLYDHYLIANLVEAAPPTIVQPFSCACATLSIHLETRTFSRHYDFHPLAFYLYTTDKKNDSFVQFYGAVASSCSIRVSNCTSE